jgi:hypothetical protein
MRLCEALANSATITGYSTEEKRVGLQELEPAVLLVLDIFFRTLGEKEGMLRRPAPFALEYESRFML